MAPSAKKLEAALISGTYEVFRDEPDATTVNKVRKHVETKLGLEDGFFAGPDWKQKSKTVIKEYVVSRVTPPLAVMANSTTGKGTRRLGPRGRGGARSEERTQASLV